MELYHQAFPIFNSTDSVQLIPTEYIFLPNFLIVGSNATEELLNSTTFIVTKLYGWDSICCSYSLCLFDAKNVVANLATGFWNNNCLILYQNLSLGLLRFSYLVKIERKLDISAKISNRLQYSSLVDLSSDGIHWQRCFHGRYGTYKTKK